MQFWGKDINIHSGGSSMNWNGLLLTLLFIGSPGIALLESLCLQKTHLEVPVPGGLTKVGYAR
jgi:hypothetical protein